MQNTPFIAEIDTHHRPLSLMTAAALYCLLIGFALRIHNLGVKSIWWDEAHSWWYAHLPLVEGVRTGMAAWHGAAGDPLYTMLLHLWISVAGDSAFAMRYLSTLIGLLAVATLGRVSADAFGNRAGRIALLLGSIAPIWIFYSQEVRQYALTPAIMLLMVGATIRIYRSDAHPPHSIWLQLVIGEMLALYTHSFMLFAVAGINLWLALLWVRDRRFDLRWLRSWVLSQVAVLLLISPTLWGYFQRIQAGHSAFVQSLSVQHILNAQWSLFMGIPWEHATDAMPVRLFVGGILVFLLIGLAATLRGSRLLADLFWLVAITQAMTIAYWTTNPVLHPRYMLFLTGPLIIILSVLISRLWQHGVVLHVISMAAIVLWILLTTSSLNNMYDGEMLGYRHDPARGMAEIVRSSFNSSDGVISIDPHDYTLDYYGIGDAALFQAGIDEAEHSPADLLDFIEGKEQIGVVRFHAERSDTRGIIPFYLERYGTLMQRQAIPSYEIFMYAMDTGADSELASFESIAQSWGVLELTGTSIQSSDAVTVALRWEAPPDFQTSARYASIVRLVDPETGWVLSTSSALLLSDQAEPTDHWLPDEVASQYYVLPLYPGTPPIEVELSVMLVDSATGQALDLRDGSGAPVGQQAVIGSVRLGDAPDTWAYTEVDPPFHLTEVESPLLAAYAADWPTSAPGGTVALTLQWKVPPELLEDRDVSVQLVQNGVVLASDDGSPLQGRTPADSDQWLERRVLHVSGEAQSGMADIVLKADDQSLVIGQIEIAGFQRIMERPEIESPFEGAFGDAFRLIGFQFDAPAVITSSSTLDLTLYWQALMDGLPGSDYLVTVQILDENGHLIGQHDGIPVEGTRPTSGWLSGEYLIDAHSITFRESYRGPATIQIALYDPVTFERIRITDGKDALVLPIELVLESTD
jgi:hypothetical protein